MAARPQSPPTPRTHSLATLPTERATGPTRAEAVQAKLSRGGALLTLQDLGDSPSKLATTMLGDSDTYYLREDVNPDYTADRLTVLSHKKYLLGEGHGDGSWLRRTAAFPSVPTMREGIKGMTGKSKNERDSIDAADVVPTDQGLPLEDMHSYAVSKLLITKQMFHDYDNLKVEDPNYVADHLEEVVRVIAMYASVGHEWYQASGQPRDGSRGYHMMAVGLGSRQSAGWGVMAAFANQTLAIDAFSSQQVSDVDSTIGDAVASLLELIDTRSGMIKNPFASKVPNKGNLETLNKQAVQGGGADGMLAALAEGNVVREAAMVSNIKGAKAPLLVQVGNAHLANLRSGVGSSAVAIDKTDDFFRKITLKLTS